MCSPPFQAQISVNLSILFYLCMDKLVYSLGIQTMPSPPIIFSEHICSKGVPMALKIVYMLCVDLLQLSVSLLLAMKASLLTRATVRQLVCDAIKVMDTLYFSFSIFVLPQSYFTKFQHFLHNIPLILPTITYYYIFFNAVLRLIIMCISLYRSSNACFTISVELDLYL